MKLDFLDRLSYNTQLSNCMIICGVGAGLLHASGSWAVACEWELGCCRLVGAGLLHASGTWAVAC